MSDSCCTIPTTTPELKTTTPAPELKTPTPEVKSSDSAREVENHASQSSTASATKHKAAILVLSDPQAGSDEALGRVFNALATAYEYKAADEEVTVLFQGAGTRWIGELQKEDHPAHALFEAVKDKVSGVSCGCADVFGGREEVEASGFELITDNQIPNTSGLASVRQLVMEGYAILTF